jgi:protein TonB
VIAPAGPVIVNWSKPKFITKETLMSFDGYVTIDVLVGPDGKVREARLNKSSEDLHLDTVAVEAAKLCTFEPANDELESIPEWTSLSYSFPLPLENESPCTREDSNPKIRQWVRPAYPAEAREKGVEGTVIVRVLVSEAGNVSESKVIQSVHKSLNAAALGAANGTQFEPAIRDCKHAPVWFALPFNFRLKNERQ